MRRGTTPTITFKLKNVPVEVIDKIVITYEQAGKIVFEKTEKDVSIINNSISFTLSETETLLLAPLKYVQFQVRCSTKSGQAMATLIYHEFVEDVLNDEVLNVEVQNGFRN